MKCAIFCFLAFCASKTVFADNSADRSSNYQASTRINDVSNKLNSDIWTAAEAAKIKKIMAGDLVNKCWSSYVSNQFSKIWDTAMSTCSQCDDKGEKNGNIKPARNCCKKAVDKFKKESKSYLALVKACIAKCAQSVAECLKEMKKQQETISEMLNKGLNPAETNI